MSVLDPKAAPSLAPLIRQAQQAAGIDAGPPPPPALSDSRNSLAASLAMCSVKEQDGSSASPGRRGDGGCEGGKGDGGGGGDGGGLGGGSGGGSGDEEGGGGEGGSGGERGGEGGL